jgi:methionyl-tRNA formyltransferase
MPLRLIFMGTPEFAVPTLVEIAGRGHDIAAVYTRAPKPAGRGMELMSSAVEREARRLGLDVLTPRSLRSDEAAAAMRSHGAQAAVVVAYGLILPQPVLDAFPLGAFNLHASLLPRWRGAAPIQRAILAGDAETGVCIMQMDEGLDTGGVLATARLAIGAETTSAQLHDQLAELGAAQILRAVNELNESRAQAIAQPLQGVTYAEKLSKAEARVNWHHAAEQIDRQIRAFNPWPIAETTLGGEAVKLLRSRLPAAAAAAAGAAAPGTVTGLQGDALEVVCGQGVLQVLELQRAGRKPVSAREFMNAARSADGSALVFQ